MAPPSRNRSDSIHCLGSAYTALAIRFRDRGDLWVSVSKPWPHVARSVQQDPGGGAEQDDQRLPHLGAPQEAEARQRDRRGGQVDDRLAAEDDRRAADRARG